MRDPQSITVNEDERMIPVWSIMVASRGVCAGGVLFLVDCAGAAAPRSAADRLSHLLQLFLGRVVALYFLMVGYISKDSPRRAMSTRFWMVVCFVMPGGIGAVHLLPAAPAGGHTLPCLQHACAERFPFLPPVQLPAYGQLRQLLPHRARDRPVLHPLRPRAGQGPACPPACMCWGIELVRNSVLVAKGPELTGRNVDPGYARSSAVTPARH